MKRVREYRRKDGTEVSEHYRNYKNTVNMTYSELLKWSKNPCSRKASLNRTPILRNLKLLKKKKSDWNKTDTKNAERTISFIKRMSKSRQGKPVKGCALSKRDISLKNWAFDPDKR